MKTVYMLRALSKDLENDIRDVIWVSREDVKKPFAQLQQKTGQGAVCYLQTEWILIPFHDVQKSVVHVAAFQSLIDMNGKAPSVCIKY